jgi:imidazolonepropionase-like amidohydrolase
MRYRPPVVEVPPQGTVLAGVTVVNPGLDRQEGQTVIVEGDRITRVSGGGPASSGYGDRSYVGCTVLPGLIDMHVHIPPQIRALVNVLFLAYGVTTVREVGDADGTTWRSRARIQTGEVPGPRIATCGPVMDGDPPFLPTSWPIRDVARARAAVAALADRGADFIKVHHKVSAEVLRAIREAAGEVGLHVVGHVPEGVPLEEAGIWDVQHLDGLVPYPRPTETLMDTQRRWHALDDAAIDAYVAVSREQGIRHTPTLVTYEALAHLAAPRSPDDPARRYLPRHYWAGVWDRENVPVLRAFTEEVLALMKQSAGRARDAVRRLHRAGVRLHLGTDTAAVPFVVPGASLQQELALMVEAGLTPDAAWAAGTRVSGASLGIDGLGVVRAGAPADLLIFGGDPSRDLGALSTLHGVVAGGRLYPKAALDEALARHRARFEQPFYDLFTTTLIRLSARVMANR